MEFRPEIVRLRQGLVADLIAVASELEAGKAVTPFQDALSRLGGENGKRLVVAAVIALDDEALEGFLAEITGEGLELATALACSGRCLELSRSEAGYSLEAGSEPKSCATPDVFLAALQASPEARAGGSSPVRRCGLPGVPEGLSLLVPANIAQLAQSPALLSLVGDQSDWIFLVGTAHSRLEPEVRRVLQTLLGRVLGVQYVLVRAGGTARSGAAEEWWKGWKSQLALGMVRNGTDLLRLRIEMLRSPSSELRQQLEEHRLKRRFDDLLQLIEEELAGMQRSLASRGGLLHDSGRTENSENGRRNVTESWRLRLTEETEAMLKSLEAETRRRLGANGDLSQQLQQAANSVSLDDILQTPADHVVKLTLRPQALTRSTVIVTTLTQVCRAEAQPRIMECLGGFRREAESILQTAAGWTGELRFQFPEPDEVQRAVDAGRPEFSYRGEMPRATLLSRFQSARQGIMGLMILGTLAGGAAVLVGDGAGATVRSTLAMLMLPLLIVGFLWTYVSFRKRDTQLLTRELEKVREGLGHELRRALQDAVREQHAFLGHAVQKAARELQQQVETALERALALRQREAEEGRRRAGEQQKAIEARITRLRTCQQQIGAMRGKSVNWQELVMRWLNSWVDRFNEGAV